MSVWKKPRRARRRLAGRCKAGCGHSAFADGGDARLGEDRQRAAWHPGDVARRDDRRRRAAELRVEVVRQLDAESEQRGVGESELGVGRVRVPRDVARSDGGLKGGDGGGGRTREAEAEWAVEVERDEPRLREPLQRRAEVGADGRRERKVVVEVLVDDDRREVGVAGVKVVGVDDVDVRDRDALGGVVALEAVGARVVAAASRLALGL